MRKVEAVTLEEAYAKASQTLECSISQLQCEVVQHPTSGLLGLFKKPAIIIVVRKNVVEEKTISEPAPSSSSVEKEEVLKDISEEESVAFEILDTLKEEAKIKEPVNFELEPLKNTVLDNFFETETSTTDTFVDEENKEVVVYDELALMIENQLKELLSHSCFDIDVVEVDVHGNTALIFIDGDDAALLIGKEGYRYNALSYMLFNWLHTKYELFIKLEIAEFLTTQQEMIRKYIKPVIENIEKQGRGKTRFLDGILVQIALEQLRERFPDKYVAVKTAKEGKKFVIINDFNSNKSNSS